MVVLDYHETAAITNDVESLLHKWAHLESNQDCPCGSAVYETAALPFWLYALELFTILPTMTNCETAILDTLALYHPKRLTAGNFDILIRHHDHEEINTALESLINLRRIRATDVAGVPHYTLNDIKSGE